MLDKLLNNEEINKELNKKYNKELLNKELNKEIRWSDEILKNKIIFFITWYCFEKLERKTLWKNL